MVKIDYKPAFKHFFDKIKDKLLKEKIIKQIQKIIQNPEVGKPMRNIRRETRELYINPFRLSYAYLPNENKIIILELYHKKKQ